MYYHFKETKDAMKNISIFIKKDKKRYEIKIIIYYINDSQIFIISKSSYEITNYYILII